MFLDRLWYPLSILLLAAIGAKLIGPHGGLQVDKQKVCQVTGSVESPIYFLTDWYEISYSDTELEVYYDGMLSKYVWILVFL